MSENTAKCIVCEIDSKNIPLVKFEYQGEEGYHICSNHLPILIHKPAELSKKLSGINLTGAKHDC